ncbi:hypothetical protein ACJJID_01500 [Microbulbifer sp. CnH-101-G]|uniref:hypothetical protein n=1 Tax=Microbulbifer sp. CnH-101-G TaxID=3243393 RepID=UPI004038FC4C
MSTPLEDYLATNPAKSPPLRDCIAIGEDNKWSTLLRDGIKNFSSGRPQTLAAHLINKGVEWEKSENIDWINSVVANSEITKAHIFHKKVCTAISSCYQQKIPANSFLEEFKRVYEGNTKSTYTEVIILIEGGFTTIEHASCDGEAILIR